MSIFLMKRLLSAEPGNIFRDGLTVLINDLFLYQRSDGGEVLGHLPEKSPRPDVPQLQGFVSEHHHQVLPEDKVTNTLTAHVS